MHDVIDSSNVIGTKVYDLPGVRIGSVESLVLTRTGGRVFTWSSFLEASLAWQTNTILCLGPSCLMTKK
ncbi:hypothetical protein ASC75_20800 [Aminobacter sp. DSM 101952]|uniref:PRC-barrel domain-containing protein n=1 Tax=Aminobacter sp. DSM 101952 TaxID=2735891 RepID=UPI000713B230|nr:PRC-barrel domain-containing protein [Aminobacter sp. DSM 101952]KQU74465.1 hypothetical protein ASC75_20800 [Aminobacter sp. DSM 101952]